MLVSKYSITTYKSALPARDPFWNRYELKASSTPHQGHIGLCHVVKCPVPGIASQSIKRKPVLTDNLAIYANNHGHWYNKLCCNEIKQLIHSQYPWLLHWCDDVNGCLDSASLKWNGFALTFDTKSKAGDTQEITQDWLQDISKRHSLFVKWQGVKLNQSCLCKALLGASHDSNSSIFFHLNLNDSNTRITSIDNYNKKCMVILCLRIKYQQQQCRRHLEIDFYSQDLCYHNRFFIGSIAYLMNQIIPIIIEFINHKQNCNYPLHFGDLNDCVCRVSCFDAIFGI